MAGEDPSQWLKEAVASHEGRLIRYARQFVGDWETARDIVQDSFLKLCQQKKASVGDPPSAWLFRVTRNRALDICKFRKRHPQIDLGALAGHEPLSPAETRDPRLALVLEVMGALNPKHREVVLLKFVHGLGYKEIRHVTGLSESNIGFILHTAVRDLRERVQRQSKKEAP
jgi:RNA polymerase sigma-70 factor (ECF subfamily)